MDKFLTDNQNFENKKQTINSGLLNIEYYDHTKKDFLRFLLLKARQIYVLPILFYQNFISPVIMPSCRFTPSCSEYTRHSILKYGIFWGTLYGAWRIFRCSPFFKGGYDPVD